MTKQVLMLQIIIRCRLPHLNKAREASLLLRPNNKKIKRRGRGTSKTRRGGS
jgi:hypothetical protein